MTEDAIREPFTKISPLIVDARRTPDIKSESLSLLRSKEVDFGNRVMALFGSNEQSKSDWAAFKPSIVINEDTTFDSVKPAIVEALKSGLEFWRASKKVGTIDLFMDQNLTLYERALDFVGVGGNRGSSASFSEAVDQMSVVASNQAEAQTKERIDNLYNEESRKGSLFLGKLAYGKIGVLWNVGGRQIFNYGEAFKENVAKVRNFISAKT